MAAPLLRKGDSRDILAAKYEIEKEDVFHVKNLYKWMHDWLVHEGWFDTDGYSDRFEPYYLEKRHQNGMVEHRVWWRLQKLIEGNDYYRYLILINFRNLAAKKIDVVHKGQKVGTWKGDLTIEVESWLQLDYKNKWKKNWFTKRMDKMYRERIYKQRWEDAKQDLWKESYKLNGFMKQFLEMKVPFEQPDSFHPVGGVGPNPRTENK